MRMNSASCEKAEIPLFYFRIGVFCMSKRILKILCIAIIYVVTSVFIIVMTHGKINTEGLIIIELLISGLTCIGIMSGNNDKK